MANTRELSQLASVISVADETRNVGIGTTNPISKLHVVGDVRVIGIVTATSFSGGSFTGNAGSATSTTNIPNLTGDITSDNLATTLATVNSNVGSFGSQTLIPVVTVNAKGLVTAVTTAAVGTALTVTGDSGSVDINLLTETLTVSGGTNLISVGSGNTLTVNLDDNISLTSVVISGVITASSFVGDGSGLTGLSANSIGALAGITIREEGSIVGGAGSIGSINFVGTNLTATASGIGVTITLSDTPSFTSVVVGSGVTINSSGINASGIITSTGGFVGNVVGVATGLSLGNSNIFIANESIKFVVNNSLIATISTTGIFSVVDLNMGLKNITNLAEPSAASDASTKNYADTGSSDFPIGDYGDFTSGDTDSFGQVISDFTSYDLLNNPSGSLQTEDFGVLT